MTIPRLAKIIKLYINHRQWYRTTSLHLKFVSKFRMCATHMRVEELEPRQGL
jgi:hypothetical protein